MFPSVSINVEKTPSRSMGRWRSRPLTGAMGKPGAGQPDPPLDGLAVIGDHGMGVVYDLNEIHEPGIVNGHIPAHTIGKGRGQGKGMGRPCQSAGLVDPLEQRAGVIPVDVIPGNIRGYVLAEQVPVVGCELVAADVLEPVFAGWGQIREAGGLCCGP